MIFTMSESPKRRRVESRGAGDLRDPHTSRTDPKRCESVRFHDLGETPPVPPHAAKTQANPQANPQAASDDGCSDPTADTGVGCGIDAAVQPPGLFVLKGFCDPKAAESIYGTCVCVCVCSGASGKWRGLKGDRGLLDQPARAVYTPRAAAAAGHPPRHVQPCPSAPTRGTTSAMT